MNNADDEIKEKNVINDDKSKPFGKFDSADELLFAYNALESEFTKRCQLLKRLQTEPDALRAQAENDGDPDGTGDGAQATPALPERKDVEPEMCVAACETQDAPPRVPDEILENVREYAEILSDIPEIMDACIARYKRKLVGMIGYAPICGAAVMAPPNRPKTLSEAKAIADRLLK